MSKIEELSSVVIKLTDAKSMIIELANAMNIVASKYAHEHNMPSEIAVQAWLAGGIALLQKMARDRNEDVEKLTQRICDILKLTISASKEQ